MTNRFEKVWAQVAAEMDLDAIREDEYRSVFGAALDNEAREQARKDAEAEVRRRRESKRTSK